jgi:hypothetical protein
MLILWWDGPCQDFSSRLMRDNVALNQCTISVKWNKWLCLEFVLIGPFTVWFLKHHTAAIVYLVSCLGSVSCFLSLLLVAHCMFSFLFSPSTSFRGNCTRNVLMFNFDYFLRCFRQNEIALFLWRMIPLWMQTPHATRGEEASLLVYVKWLTWVCYLWSPKQRVTN